MRELPDDDSWMLDDRRVIGARIRAERKRQRLSQNQLILAARIDRVTIWRVETGRDTSLSTLQRIAHVLDVPLSDLVQ
ncbi:helix-turn-helix transcriptional regulator [Streptomyces phaeolivaceus]|uniref:Helix-turn-helix transcriptional regulator n=1 Tax=Streptomyces phaeolivaceus TaxID=2653200 RepID=A0A5P8KBJ5_9ACTN|nr:helix-turn-helix transcriptional regulator [Streptomyces phaeolivaceus]QFR00704.1 helix-turn-helix transcriptional regulator [Streptomyces phaeolivaceus]